MSYTFNEIMQNISDKIEALETGEVACETRGLLLQDISNILDVLEKQRVNVLEATKQAVSQNQAQQQEILVEHQRHNLVTNQMVAFFTESKERIERIKLKEHEVNSESHQFKKNSGDFFSVKSSDFNDILTSLKSEYGASFKITDISGYVAHFSNGGMEKLTLNYAGSIRPPMDVMLARNSLLNISFMEGVYFCNEEQANKTIVLVK